MASAEAGSFYLHCICTKECPHSVYPSLFLNSTYSLNHFPDFSSKSTRDILAPHIELEPITSLSIILRFKSSYLAFFEVISKGIIYSKLKSGSRLLSNGFEEKVCLEKRFNPNLTSGSLFPNRDLFFSFLALTIFT